MAITPDMISPGAPVSATDETVAPAVTAEEPATPPEEVELPPEVASIPAVQAVTAGNPPAVSVPLKGAEKREDILTIANNAPALQEAGIGFYKSISGELGVMFNMLRLAPADIIAADKAGKLATIAPDFDKVNQTVSGSGIEHPALSRNRSPVPTTIPASLSTSRPPQTATGTMPQPAPASAIRKLAAQRVLNLGPGAPTSGPEPGAGRLLNRILRPAV